MPIMEDADTVERLLGIGDEVETDDGVGVITDITLNAADYNGEWQLEPPSIEVKLEDGTTVHTCICSLKIPEDDDATELLHQEYGRLWPAMQDEVPEDADSLIPEGDEEEDVRTGSAHQRRSAMVIGPNDKFFVVLIPLPGHPYMDPYGDPDWEVNMIYEATMEDLRNIHRGRANRHTADLEEEFIATTYDEALEIVFDYFPELRG